MFRFLSHAELTHAMALDNVPPPSAPPWLHHIINTWMQPMPHPQAPSPDVCTRPDGSLALPPAITCDECGYRIVIFSHDQIELDFNGLGDGKLLMHYYPVGGNSPTIQEHESIRLCDRCLAR